MIATALVAFAGSLSLPPARAEVASRVVGDGFPNCTSYFPDGTSGPCTPEFTVRPGNEINAEEKGSVIEFTHGAAHRLTDDEFALVVGHELAHWYLMHNAINPANELAADQLGAILACKAGFDPHAGATFFRFARAGKTHPNPKFRRKVVLEVECPVSNDAMRRPG